MAVEITETPQHQLVVDETNWTLTMGGSVLANSITSDTPSDGTADLYVETISFNTANGAPVEMGEVTWNSTSGSLEMMLQNGVVAPVNESSLIRVRNTSGSTIAKGTPLVYTGTPGASGRLEVAAWTGANVSNARAFLGFAAGEMDTGDNKDGYASWLSKIEGIATDGDDYGETWSDGDIIYAVPSASSTLTNVQPTTGEWVVAAAVINAGSGTSGSMFVRPSWDKAAGNPFDQSLNTTDNPTFANLDASGTVTADSSSSNLHSDVGSEFGIVSAPANWGDAVSLYGGLTAGDSSDVIVDYGVYEFSDLTAGSTTVIYLPTPTSPTRIRASLSVIVGADSLLVHHNDGATFPLIRTITAGTEEVVIFVWSGSAWSVEEAYSPTDPTRVEGELSGPHVQNVGTTDSPTFGNLTASGTIKTGTYTVAALPAAATAGAGARAFVTDSDTAASGNFGTTFAGSGANAVPVYSDGTNWRIG